ncbi:uncharacterized protein LOC127156179 [Labeo rohita]|uniref:uncharacterized protein LOC127156179 n=1 Tax=Labeo rohita TaxID=84645 RepID=UPI0021E1EC6B|nr:uncharacterized protein LOC127156179 [Labeo rohita]
MSRFPHQHQLRPSQMSPQRCQSHGQGLDPNEKLQEPEPEQIRENKRSDQEDLMQDDETLMTQRSYEYDPEEGMPALVVTQPDEISSDQAEDINLSVMYEDVMHSDSSRNASPCDGTELSSSDLLSLKSDTISLISEAAISCKSDEQEGPEEDTRSVTASSVMSLFHRVQMDPTEREWLRCAALGNATALYLLLQQDPTLISKKGDGWTQKTEKRKKKRKVADVCLVVNHHICAWQQQRVSTLWE